MNFGEKLKSRPFLIVCFVLIVLSVAGFVMAKNYYSPSDGFSVSEEVYGQRLNVLLMGIDARSGAIGRSDSIILASVDTKSSRATLLSIPRDTRVQLPGHGWGKINDAIIYGGPELSARVVSDLLGVPVHYYVLADFNGFKEIVDTLGGVTIDVEQNMYHEDDGAFGINLKKGVQRLNGEKALQYVRYRGYISADIERTQHQQKFLAALAHEMFQSGTILKLPALIPQINRSVKTNLGTGDLYQLAAAANKLKDINMLSQTLPGRGVTIDDLSYWAVDPRNARLVMAKLSNGETIEVVQNTPIDPKVVGVTSFAPAVPELPHEPDSAKEPAVLVQSGTDKTVKPGQGDKPSGIKGKLPQSNVTITPAAGGTGATTGVQGKPGTPVPGTSSSGPGVSGKTDTGPAGSGSGASVKTDTGGAPAPNPVFPGAGTGNKEPANSGASGAGAKTGATNF